MIVRRIYESANGVLAIADDLFIEMWHRPGTAAMLREANLGFRREMTRRSKRKIFTLAVMQMPPSTMLKLSDEERALITERVEEMGALAFAGVTVVAMSGFSGAVVRSVMGGVVRFRKAPFPTQVVGSVEEAVPIARARLNAHGGAYTDQDVRDAIARARPESWAGA